MDDFVADAPLNKKRVENFFRTSVDSAAKRRLSLNVVEENY